MSRYDTAPGEAADLPVRRTKSGHLAVAVHVNGSGPYDFIVESGAGMTAVFPNLIRTLELAKVGEACGAGCGGTATMNIYKLSSLVLGDRAGFGDHMVVEPALDCAGDEQIYGLLGVDILTRYRVLYDATSATLSLLDPDSRSRLEKAAEVPFSGEVCGLVKIMMKVNGKALEAIVDTGARRSATNWSAAARHGVTMESDEVEYEADKAGAAGESTPTYLWHGTTIEVGQRRWADRTLFMADLPAFEMLAEDKPFGLLGIDVLQASGFELDYKNKLLRLPLD